MSLNPNRMLKFQNLGGHWEPHFKERDSYLSNLLYLTVCASLPSLFKDSSRLSLNRLT